MPLLKVLLVDYASSGADVALPLSLRRQQQMTARAVMTDLAGVAGVELLALLEEGPFWRRFDAGVRAADAVWLLAPAAGGVLERLSRHVLRNGRILLGSQPGALRIAGSRRRTSHTLARAGIDVAPTYAPGQNLPATGGAWIVRPDDGALWIDSHLFPGSAAALGWIAASGAARPPGSPRSSAYILQSFVSGKSGNLALLCRDGGAQLLGCNEQRVAMRDNQLHLLGTTVNNLFDDDGVFERLAQAVAAAIPGLWGHVGVDFVLTGQGPVVLEISAPLGPSYAGLHASIGCNPAARALDLLDLGAVGGVGAVGALLDLTASSHLRGQPANHLQVLSPSPTPTSPEPQSPPRARPRDRPLAVSVDVAAFGSA